MPDELAVAMSPSEFIHLIEYLSTLKDTPNSFPEDAPER
jgi:hypothetical protein